MTFALNRRLGIEEPGQEDQAGVQDDFQVLGHRLGLFNENLLLPTDRNTPLDWLNVLTLQKMALSNHERDMVVMHHEFISQYENKREYITSTLVNYGIPDNDSAVARTVALPAAIAVKLILNGTISIKGVHIPVQPAIYNPILNELAEMDITFVDQTSPLPI